jgi:hypothetical protein
MKPLHFISITGCARLIAWITLAVLAANCRDARQSNSQGSGTGIGHSTADARYSYHSRVLGSLQSFDVYTEGNGSLRSMHIVHALDGIADTTTMEIDGNVINAQCGDLDRDSLPELYIVAQSAGSGSYARLYGFLFEGHEKKSFTLPDLDKRLAAGYMGHDSLWVQDTVLLRRFPVFTESDINASASGGTRTLEYVLQHNREGNPSLSVARVINHL